MSSITYHGDDSAYPYRVVDNGLWIASVPHYLAGDVVLTEQALMRIWANVMERLSNLRPCPSCGDLTATDECAACSEDRLIDLPLDVEFAAYGF